jgi:Uncharacterized conserved protein
MASYFSGIFHTQEGWYAVFFPDFPEAITQGETLEECLTLGADVLAIVVEEYTKERKELPQPTNFEKAWEWAVEKAKEEDLVQGVVPILQLFRAPEINLTPVRISVSIAKSTLDEIDAKADRLGMTRSGFLARAALEMKV